MGIGKKKDFDYFGSFEKMAALAVKASNQLEDLLTNYVDITKKADLIHDTEHASDDIHHELVFELSRSFITPIDREDILEIGDFIDSIIDNIEDVANLMDMLSIKDVREEAKILATLLTSACTVIESAVIEFKNFRKTGKQLHEHVVEVNRFEEEADRIYRKTIKKLFLEETRPVELIKWKEIFDMLENAFDACEDLADILSAAAIKNS